jgi:Rrf2 family protein
MEDAMKLITKETDYALRAVLNLARVDGYMSSRKISEKEGIPLHFLRRILQSLIKAGVIESREGAAGGVRLKAKPETIHLTDIIQIFQGRIQFSECIFRKKICTNHATCVIRKRIESIESKVADELGKTTIADLLQDQEVKT